MLIAVKYGAARYLLRKYAIISAQMAESTALSLSLSVA